MNHKATRVRVLSRSIANFAIGCTSVQYNACRLMLNVIYCMHDTILQRSRNPTNIPTHPIWKATQRYSTDRPSQASHAQSFNDIS